MTAESPFLRDEKRRLREPSITALNQVPIVECGEPLLDLREACPGIFTEAPLPWARETVCRMLSEAARRIPPDTRLLVATSMRTLDMQAAAWHTYYDHLVRLHPAWPKPVLYRETNRFLHPPHAECPPGHTTGGAADVRLVDPDGHEFEDFLSQLTRSHLTWRTFSEDVPPASRTRRQTLYDAMVGVGFSNCPDEWWHYSWGDSGWAKRLGHDHALYGLVPEESFPPEMSEMLADLRARGDLTRIRRRLGG